MIQTTLNTLTNQEVLIKIQEEYLLRIALMITTTLKQYVIVFQGNCYQTNDLNRTVRRLLNDYPNCKAFEMDLIDAKEYQTFLNSQ